MNTRDFNNQVYQHDHETQVKEYPKSNLKSFIR